ncbi:MAG: hypothetical protein JNM88_09855 [Chitinophagaceae bacterium]|nr:hypothetical protein [Chitinophagaceae bacterium]
MQRRNFISNLAVILPAGAVAPNLLFENRRQYKNLSKTDVVILGAGQAALFIANTLKKQKLSVIIAEPTGGISQAAAHNHADKPGIIRQTSKHTKAEVNSITERHYGDIAGEVKTGFIPSEIKRTAEGFIVTDGEQSFQAEKLVVALPVSMDTENSMMQISTSDKHSISVSCKKKGDPGPLQLRTTAAGRIDEEMLTRFAAGNKPAILAIV